MFRALSPPQLKHPLLLTVFFVLLRNRPPFYEPPTRPTPHCITSNVTTDLLLNWNATHRLCTVLLLCIVPFGNFFFECWLA